MLRRASSSLSYSSRVSYAIGTRMSLQKSGVNVEHILRRKDGLKVQRRTLSRTFEDISRERDLGYSMERQRELRSPQSTLRFRSCKMEKETKGNSVRKIIFFPFSLSLYSPSSNTVTYDKLRAIFQRNTYYVLIN